MLYALTVFNGEYTGGWLVGEGNYQRWITAQHPAEIPLDQKLTHYEQLASDALAGEIVGSLRAESSQNLPNAQNAVAIKEIHRTTANRGQPTLG